MGSLLRMAGLQYSGIISGVKQFNILTVSPNRDSVYRVIAHKNVTKVLVNMVSGVTLQVQRFNVQRFRG
jgi:uncharacterized protein (UPF0548 family)